MGLRPTVDISFMFLFEVVRITLFARGTFVGESTDAISIFLLLSLSKGIAVVFVGHEDRGIITESRETVLLLTDLHFEVEFAVLARRILAGEAPACSCISLLVIFEDLVNVVTLLGKVKVQLGIVLVVEILVRRDVLLGVDHVLETAQSRHIRHGPGSIAHINWSTQMDHHVHFAADLEVVPGRWVHRGNIHRPIKLGEAVFI